MLSFLPLKNNSVTTGANLLAWQSKKHKALKNKIKKKLMPIVWHPKRWWNLCLPEYEKKEIEPIFTE